MTMRSTTPQPFCAALQVAAEHCQYERCRGRKPAEVIRATGRKAAADATWKDARRVLAQAWVQMQFPSTSEAVA